MQAFYFPDTFSNFLYDLSQLSYNQFIVLTDAKTNGYCWPKLSADFSTLPIAGVIAIPDGEHFKSIETVHYIWTQLMRFNTDRKTAVILIGGGVLCDMGNFACHVYKRGIDCIHLPTTLLAMVDASYGGKTAINVGGIKNNVGTFHHPICTVILPELLRTLSERHIRNGMAEMYKHALLTGSEAWQHMLQASLQELCTPLAIAQSIQYKKKIVDQDPLDEHIRQSLNLGHSIGHAIEAFSLQNHIRPLLHGEAIMWGLYYELALSEIIYGCPTNYRIELKEIMTRYYHHLLSLPVTIDAILPFLVQDKKNNANIRMSLLKDAGQCCIQTPVSVSDLKKVMQ